jgi:hypothetical protein
MAFTTLPKENPQRNNKHVVTILDRREDNELVGPDLHWSLDWHPKTREWWDTWRRTEIAVMLEPSDWEFLEDTALLHHETWNNKRASIAQKTAALAEIRQRVAKFGATFEDRLKLRIKFADVTIREDKAKAGPQVDKKVNYAELMQEEE